jgi:hypothetical protein
MARSDYVIGRRASRAAFRRGETFTVSAYTYLDGVRYTDPVKNPPGPKSRISYRIIVKPKRGKDV